MRRAQGQQGMAAQPNVPLESLCPTFGSPHQQQATVRVPGSTRVPVCPTCHMTFTEFRQSGLMDAPIATARSSRNSPAFSNGSARGWIRPCRNGPKPDRRHDHTKPGTHPTPRSRMRVEPLKAIRAKLDDAVKAEHYGMAARLRDELKS